MCAAKTPVTAVRLGGATLPGWMLTDGVKDATQVDNASSIELKRGDGCAPGRSQPYYDCEVVIPRKMSLPFLLARVEQSDCQFGDWICR